MLKKDGVPRITGIFCIVILAFALIGIAGAPSDSYADGSPGGADPPPSLDPPPDTTGNPEGGPDGYDNPEEDLPLGLDATLTILKLTI